MDTEQYINQKKDFNSWNIEKIALKTPSETTGPGPLRWVGDLVVIYPPVHVQTKLPVCVPLIGANSSHQHARLKT